MKTFVWDEKYMTGLATVDAQHQKLVGLINNFADALVNQANLDRAYVDTTFMALALYAKEHFADEEELMLSAGIDPRFLTAHQSQHRGFISNVTEMHQSLREGMQPGDDLGRGLMGFLVNWLASHILRTDHEMARQMALLARGVSGAEAYAGGDHAAGESTALVAGALHELLRALAQRNRELAEANQTLEQRVSARTQDLTHTNAQLETAMSELQQTQDMLIETAKLGALGQLASGFADEIRQPLSHLGPNIDRLVEATSRLRELLRDYERAEPGIGSAVVRLAIAGHRERANLPFYDHELPALVTATREGLARVETVVRNLKELGVPDAGALSAVELNTSLDLALALVPAELKADFTVRCEYGTPPAVACRPTQLNQTLVALITNAFQAVAARGHGEVLLRSGEEGDRSWVEVVDTGAGMSADVRSHLFEPFFTTRPPGKGFGLGLSRCWSFARSQGGRIEVDTEEGRGTRVRLTLSRAAPAHGAS